MTGCIEGARITEALDRVRARIASACLRSGRPRDAVRLLPVSKTVPVARMAEAVAAGVVEFGENKVQEARGKAEAMDGLGVRWSIIGHLQTNKVKHVARFASEFQALDDMRIAEALDRRLQAEGRELDVFIQVNTSSERSKYGVAPDEALRFARDLTAFSALSVRGLMTLAVFSKDASEVRRCFQRLRAVRDRLRQEGPRAGYDELSMGMSGDFEIAIEEGATVVRLGTAIFGQRPLPDSHYWPDQAVDRAGWLPR